MGVEASDDHLSVGDVLRTGDPKVALAATVTSGWGEGVDVLPSSRNLIDREGDPHSAEAMLRLRTAMAPIIDDYRFVFIDCAPSLGPTTRSGLAMSDRVLLVVELSALSIRGADAVLDTVEEIWSELNPDLDVGGVIVNRAASVVERGRPSGARARPLDGQAGRLAPVHPAAHGAQRVRRRTCTPARARLPGQGHRRRLRCALPPPRTCQPDRDPLAVLTYDRS